MSHLSEIINPFIPPYAYRHPQGSYIEDKFTQTKSLDGRVCPLSPICMHIKWRQRLSKLSYSLTIILDKVYIFKCKACLHQQFTFKKCLSKVLGTYPFRYSTPPWCSSFIWNKAGEAFSLIGKSKTLMNKWIYCPL